jgi:type IV secretory pathway TraG/TraD family ATPase VirD4
MKLNTKPSNKPKMINLHGVAIPREWLVTGLVILGTTGSGKSRGIIRPILKSCIAQGDAAVVYDVKGDLLPIVREALAASGRSKDLVVLGTGETDRTFNPLSDETLKTHQIVHQLLTAASLTGPAANQRSSNEDLFWSSARVELLCALVELARQSLAGTGEPLNFSHLQKLRANLSQSSSAVNRWAKEVSAIIPENSGASLIEYASLPDNTRSCVLNSVTNVIAPYLRPPLSNFVSPTAARPAFLLTDLFNQSKVVVVTAGQAEHSNDLWPAFLLFKQALYRLCLARPRLPVRQDNHVLVILDEYTRMLTSHDAQSSEHVVMEQSRSSRFSFVLASQNLSGLEAIGGHLIVDKIMALASNFCFLANNCPATARLAQRVLGTRKTFVRHESVVSLPPPPLLFPAASPATEKSVTNTVLVPVEEPVVSAADLSLLKPGEVHLKLLDGSTHKIQCTFD